MVNISSHTIYQLGKMIRSTALEFHISVSSMTFFFTIFLIPMYTICYDWYIIKVVSIYKIDIAHRED